VFRSESDLIERYFCELGAPRTDVALGIGDDAALLRPAAGYELALTTDALIEGVHFLQGAPARSLGHRALAVNLSDIAAMGAAPCWALLSLNLPLLDEAWLADFADGFGALARAHGVALVGGNLSRGALCITVALAGQVPAASALRRDGARPGDALYVSGCLGDAAAGLAQLRADEQSHGVGSQSAVEQYLRARFEYPTPRVALGQALRGVASACIDLSDGLYGDLGRLLQASACGAQLETEALPLSAALRSRLGTGAWQAALSGGEDYELCFSVPIDRTTRLEAIAAQSGEALTRIGTVRSEGGIALMQAKEVIQFSPSSFDHFRH
jgi:thiamine-monophosphate kinase